MRRVIVHRLFFGLIPPRDRWPPIAAHRDGEPGLYGLVRDDRLHMTAAITPDFTSFPEGLACAMRERAWAVLAPPATVVLDRVAASRSSVALRPSRTSPALRDLFSELAALLVGLGAMRSGWSANPHVTLGYREGEPFNRRIEPIAWESHEFVLIHSEVGATRHHVLGHWPLEPRQGGFDF